MKILLIADYDLFGGTRSFLLRLLELHKQNNISTSILMQEKQADDKMIGICNKHGIPIQIIPNRTSIYFKPYLSLFYEVIHYHRIIRAFSPDIIVVSTGDVGTNLGVFLYRTPVLFILHTYPRRKAGWKTAGMWLITHFLSSQAKRFATVSEYSARQIHGCMGVPREYIDVIYNCYSHSPKAQYSRKESIVLTIGHVVNYKNPLIWLEVAQRVIARDRSIRFIWLGDGDMLDEMQATAANLELGENIVFYGYTTEIEKFYAESNIYFQPSLMESHGIGVVEAMVHGLPCIVSNVGGLPESVIDNQTGYVCAVNDVKGFAEKIVQCIRDPQLSKRFGDAGRRRALELFNEERQGLKLLQLYQKINGSYKADCLS